MKDNFNLVINILYLVLCEQKLKTLRHLLVKNFYVSKFFFHHHVSNKHNYIKAFKRNLNLLNRESLVNETEHSKYV